MGYNKTRRTRYEILQYATHLFLEKGYTDAFVTTIAKELKISTGNLTFWFPTKEHILAELIDELCSYEWDIKETVDKEGNTLLETYMNELITMASVCTENLNIQDLILAAYTRPLSIAIIRENDTKKARQIFGEFCQDWVETDFIQAENVVFGIEYAMFLTENTQQISFEQRMSSGMDAIMKVYDVPEGIRKGIIKKVLANDYKSKGRTIFDKFCNYVKEKSAEEFEMVVE